MNKSAILIFPFFIFFKIMSPTSQEKLCSALTGIDLCGVQRLSKQSMLFVVFLIFFIRVVNTISHY
jgi:hypothetical protein